MSKHRLEAFSDGVLAILITIMVLDLKSPHGTNWHDLVPLIPVFLSYVLSFVYLAIYWNNHHHLIQAIEKVNGAVLWANMHLLFWLSLVPFVTSWAGENHLAAIPVAAYGFTFMMAAIAYFILTKTLTVSECGYNPLLSKALGQDFKGKISIVIYLAGIALAFWQPMLAVVCYAFVALMWIIPDRRIEREMSH